MIEPLILPQPELGEDLDAVSPALTEAFAAIKAAVLEDRPVVVTVDDRDLLGQGSVIGAALATGLLGLCRTVAIEGAKPGWRVNVVSHPGEPESEAVLDAIAWVGSAAISGQLIRVGGQVGRVQP